MYPCCIPHPCAGPSVVSSQESHEPHGVGPPAQLMIVPLRLMKSRTSVADPSGARRTSRDVQPPPPRGSYAREASPFTLAVSGLSRFSWLRMSRTFPLGIGNAAIPSNEFGVGFPSDIGFPAVLTTEYANPAGSASSAPAGRMGP